MLFQMHCANKLIRMALYGAIKIKTKLQKFLSQGDADLLLKMCDDRNLTVHRYDEDYLAEVAEMVIEYYHKIKPALFKIVEQANE